MHTAVHRNRKRGSTGEKNKNQRRRLKKSGIKEATEAQDVTSADGSETSEGSITNGVESNCSTDDDGSVQDSNLSRLASIEFLGADGKRHIGRSRIACDRSSRINDSQGQGGSRSSGGCGGGCESYQSRGLGEQREGPHNLGSGCDNKESDKSSTLDASSGWPRSPSEGGSVPSQDNANAGRSGRGERRLIARARGLARWVVTNASLPHRLGQRSSQRLSREEAVAEGRLYDSTDYNPQSEQSFDAPELHSSSSSSALSNDSRNPWFQNRQPFSSATMAILVDGCDGDEGVDSVPANVATGNHRLRRTLLSTNYEEKSRGNGMKNCNVQLNEWGGGNDARRVWGTGVEGQDSPLNAKVDTAKYTSEEAKDTAASALNDELFHADYGVVTTWRFVKGPGERHTTKDRKRDPAAAACTATLKKTKAVSCSLFGDLCNCLQKRSNHGWVFTDVHSFLSRLHRSGGAWTKGYAASFKKSVSY